jgi:hypothetical protein
MDRSCDQCGSPHVLFDVPHVTRCYRDAEADADASLRVYVYLGHCEDCGERQFRVLEPTEAESEQRVAGNG